MPMELTLRVAAAAPANETASFFKRVEDAGFVGAGIPDTQLIMRDVYVSLALARIHRRTRMDGVRAAEGGWVRELQGRWPGLLG